MFESHDGLCLFSFSPQDSVCVCVCLCFMKSQWNQNQNLILLQEISRERELIPRFFSFEGEVKNYISCEDRLICDVSIKNAYDIVYSSIKGSPGGSDGKESACNVRDLGSIPGLVRSPGGGHGNPIQYSHLENPHEQRSLVGYSLWGCKESDMTERLSPAQLHKRIEISSPLCLKIMNEWIIVCWSFNVSFRSLSVLGKIWENLSLWKKYIYNFQLYVVRNVMISVALMLEFQ